MPMGRSWMPALCRLMPRNGELQISSTEPAQQDCPESGQIRSTRQVIRKFVSCSNAGRPQLHLDITCANKFGAVQAAHLHHNLQWWRAAGGP